MPRGYEVIKKFSKLKLRSRVFDWSEMATMKILRFETELRQKFYNLEAWTLVRLMKLPFVKTEYYSFSYSPCTACSLEYWIYSVYIICTNTGAWCLINSSYLLISIINVYYIYMGRVASMCVRRQIPVYKNTN
jgi:hypothetical protein